MWKNAKSGLVFALACAAAMWFYVDRILVPYQRADAARYERPRGNLSDLYPRWLGARELLLRGRNPYSQDVTREIQVGYYGRELDPGRPGDPKDQQGFAYPVYIVLFLAPTVQLPFDQVQRGFGWVLFILTALSVLLWLRAVRWWPHLPQVAMIAILVMGSFPVVQGFKLQQISLVVATLVAASSALLVKGRLFAAGGTLAVATVKPQLVLPMVLWLLVWTASDWDRRKRFAWGFGAVLALLLCGSEVLLPGWFGNFLTAAQDYRRYAGGMSMLDVLLSPSWGRGAAGVLIVAVGIVCWRFRKTTHDSPAFALMVALVLAVTVIVIPMFAPYNYLLVLPTLLLLARDWPVTWSSSAVSRAGLLLVAGAVMWPWVAALGMGIASVMLPPETVQRGWWLPLYTSAKVPIPLVCLIPLSVEIASAWRKEDELHPSPNATQVSEQGTR